MKHTYNIRFQTGTDLSMPAFSEDDSLPQVKKDEWALLNFLEKMYGIEIGSIDIKKEYHALDLEDMEQLTARENRMLREAAEDEA